MDAWAVGLEEGDGEGLVQVCRTWGHRGVIVLVHPASYYKVSQTRWLQTTETCLRGWEVQGHGVGRCGVVPGEASFLVHSRHLLAVSPHGGSGNALEEY